LKGSNVIVNIINDHHVIKNDVSV